MAPATTGPAPRGNGRVGRPSIMEGWHRRRTRSIASSRRGSRSAPTSTSRRFPDGWESRSSHIQPPSGGSVSEHPLGPTNSSLTSITKTRFSRSQFTFLSTSAPLASLPAFSSPPGHDGSTMSITHHASKTTTNKHRAQKTTQTGKATAGTKVTSTDSSSHETSSVNAAVGRYSTPKLLDSFGAMLAGMVFGDLMLL